MYKNFLRVKTRQISLKFSGDILIHNNKIHETILIYQVFTLCRLAFRILELAGRLP
jgi:hypothetical protein